MHVDRAQQFSRRLRWEVVVDENGEEHDEYDLLNPLYIVSESCDGEHEGSLRFLPTTGRTMVNEHFLELTDGVNISSPHIWECTRFCISPTADRRVAAKLLAAGAYLMKECCIDYFVGVFDEKMERIYRAIGSSPTVLGRRQTTKGKFAVGLWNFQDQTYQKILRNAEISECELDLSLEFVDLHVYPGALAATELSSPRFQYH